MPSFNDSQQLCIATTDRNLLVSAGAGAGKTATLVERLYAILAHPARRCTIDELLVVTFSRAAAQEMKSRLVGRLREGVEDETLPPGLRDHIEDQLLLLPRATISTIHSFCLHVITAHADRVGLTPEFDLMSEEEARLFRADFLRNQLEETLGRGDDNAEALRALLYQLDPLAGVDQILAQVTSFHQFLESVPYPDAFAERATRLFEVDPATGGPGPEFMALTGASIREVAESIGNDARRGIAFADRPLHPKFADQVAFLRDLGFLCRNIASSADPTPQLPILLGSLRFPNLSRAKGELTAHDEDFAAWRTRMADRMKKWAEKLAAFTPDSLRADFDSSRRNVTLFLHELGLHWWNSLFAAHLEERRLTFSHLERLALRILCNPDGTPTDVALMYRQIYRYVLVDEFQDVNELQNLIIRSISRDATPQTGGNLFVVGDVKQSIYEFRQADPTLFVAKYDQSADLVTHAAVPVDSRINLRENYRSHAALLAEFNSIFRLLLQKRTIGIDYTDGHEFTPGRAEDEESPRAPALSIEILPKQEPDDADDAEDITLEALHVAALVDQLGPPWKDICILLRSTVGTATDLTEALRQRGIPVFSDSRIGFLTAVEVIEFQALLKAIYNPYDDIALLGALRGPAARWNEEQLLALRAVERDTYFFDNLRNLATRSDESAANFLNAMQRWQHASMHNPMEQFFAILFDELHLLEQAAVRAGGDQRRLNLLQMLSHARQFDQFLRKGLGAFLQFLDDLIANEEDFAPPMPLPENADVVRIMSVHKSKGMQFPIVVVPFVGRKFNEIGLNQPFLYDRRVGLASKFRDEPTASETTPPLFELLRRERRNRERAEELRLFYVALTRAKEAVYITASEKAPAAVLDERLKTHAGSDPPTPGEILAAVRPIDWLWQYIARRVAANPSFPTDGVFTDGIVRIAVHDDAPPIPPPANAAKDARERNVDPALIEQFNHARRRVEAHAALVTGPSIRAKISVTEAKRAFDATRDAETPPMRPNRPARAHALRSWIPESLRADATAPSQVQRGTATHRFLAACDLVALARGERRLREELDRLLAERILTPDEAPLINLHDIAWFLNCDLGKRLRREGARLLRERPFTVRIDGDELTSSPTTEPVILQGVVDVLFREPEGWTIIDYKTDDCGPDDARLNALRDVYTPQIQLYRLCADRTFRQPIAQSWLVFLQARQAVEVPPATPSTIRWETVIEAAAVIHPEPQRRTITPRA